MTDGPPRRAIPPLCSGGGGSGRGQPCQVETPAAKKLMFSPFSQTAANATSCSSDRNRTHKSGPVGGGWGGGRSQVSTLSGVSLAAPAEKKPPRCSTPACLRCQPAIWILLLSSSSSSSSFFLLYIFFLHLLPPSSSSSSSSASSCITFFFFMLRSCRVTFDINLAALGAARGFSAPHCQYKCNTLSNNCG